MGTSTTPIQRNWTQSVYDHALLDGRAINFFLEEINPSLSLLECSATVVGINQETHDTRSFVLKPSWGWSRFVAGQHIGVTLEINGVSYRRRYSISSAPGKHRRAPLTITVKREPGGRISNALHDQLRVGDKIKLDRPAGDFVLPSKLPQRLLMLAAGSGITPIMSQVRSLLAHGYQGDISLLAYVRSEQDHIFGEQLEQLAAKYSTLKLRWCEESNNQERFSPEQLAKHVPDYAQRHTMLCGPAGFMAVVREHWQALDLNPQLQFEYFGSPQALQPQTKSQGVAAHIHLQRSGRKVEASEQQSALLALEAAGEAPSYGCRIGICQSCKCTKVSGQVRNILTGQISREPNEAIQLCISAAETDLVLDY
ncbi:MAG: ferredoxin reductase [Oceanococcus sp.]